MGSIEQGSSMVEIRLFKRDDERSTWKNVNVSAYLPTFLTGEQNISNVTKRINLMYFKRPSAVHAICWTLQGDENPHWIDSPFL